MMLDSVREEFLGLAVILGGINDTPKGARARRHRKNIVRAIYLRTLNVGITMRPRARDYAYETMRDEVLDMWRNSPPWLRVNPIVWMDAAISGLTRGWKLHDDMERLDGLTYQRPPARMR